MNALINTKLITWVNYLFHIIGRLKMFADIVQKGTNHKSKNHHVSLVEKSSNKCIFKWEL